MAARAARTPAMRMVVSTVGGDTRFSSPVPFYGIGILCRALAGQVGRFFEVRANAWVATSVDTASSLEASSSRLFSCWCLRVKTFDSVVGAFGVVSFMKLR